MYKKLIWPFVFIISIGGFWFPILGLTMYPMLIFIMFMGFFNGRYWCGHLCPRGAMLDVPVTKFSHKGKRIPHIFKGKALKILALVTLMGFFILNTVRAFNYWDMSVFWEKLGMVGVIMCAITTALALILGFSFKPRTWCAFCPMGTVQTSLYKIRRRNK
ncbi:MAG: 4Fe-4S binding protein [Pseudomonadota bacterium]